MKEFLFDSNIALTQNDKILFAIFIGLVVLGILELIFRRSAVNPAVKMLHSRLLHLGFTIGILGAAWGGMRYLFVPYLGARFTAVLVILVGLVWGVFIAVYGFRAYPEAKKEWEQKRMKEKYLKQ